MHTHITITDPRINNQWWKECMHTHITTTISPRTNEVTSGGRSASTLTSPPLIISINRLKTKHTYILNFFSIRQAAVLPNGKEVLSKVLSKVIMTEGVKEKLKDHEND